VRFRFRTVIPVPRIVGTMSRHVIRFDALARRCVMVRSRRVGEETFVLVDRQRVN